MVSRTKLTKEEREKITSGAVAAYCNAAKHIAKDNPFPGTQHHAFEGEYESQFVWAKCILYLGESRADRLSNDNFFRLLDGAKRHFKHLVSMGLITERGLPIERLNEQLARGTVQCEVSTE